MHQSPARIIQLKTPTKKNHLQKISAKYQIDGSKSNSAILLKIHDEKIEYKLGMLKWFYPEKVSVSSNIREEK